MNGQSAAGRRPAETSQASEAAAEPHEAPSPARRKGDIARDRIKRAARGMFAHYGIDAVTIRDIARSAGQRNAGAVNYYFGSKEDLLLEILNDAAREADIVRSRTLDALEASGKTIMLRDILKVLIDVGGLSEEQMRLFTMLQMYRRDLMHTEIPGRWDSAFRRCVEHLRGLLPYSEEILRQRLYFLIPYLWTFMATREGGADQAQFWKRFWADPSSMEGFLDTAEGILAHAPSPETLSVQRDPAAGLPGAVRRIR